MSCACPPGTRGRDHTRPAGPVGPRSHRATQRCHRSAAPGRSPRTSGPRRARLPTAPPSLHHLSERSRGARALSDPCAPWTWGAGYQRCVDMNTHLQRWEWGPGPHQHLISIRSPTEGDAQDPQSPAGRFAPQAGTRLDGGGRRETPRCHQAIIAPRTQLICGHADVNAGDPRSIVGCSVSRYLSRSTRGHAPSHAPSGEAGHQEGRAVGLAAADTVPGAQRRSKIRRARPR